MPILPLALLAGGAVAGGLANKKSARTGTSSSTTTNKSTNSITRDLLPFQNDLIGPLGGYATDLLSNPGKMIEPIRARGIDAINRRYDGAPAAIAKKSLAFGGSQSGKFGRAVREAEFQRYGDLGDFEGSLAELILNQQNFGASLAERLLGMNFGSTQTSDGTQTFEGENIQPGSAGAGALTGGLDALTTLLLLDAMGKGGGVDSGRAETGAAGSPMW